MVKKFAMLFSVWKADMDEPLQINHLSLCFSFHLLAKSFNIRNRKRGIRILSLFVE
jgi:hypothetical protein